MTVPRARCLDFQVSQTKGSKGTVAPALSNEESGTSTWIAETWRGSKKDQTEASKAIGMEGVSELFRLISSVSQGVHNS